LAANISRTDKDIQNQTSMQFTLFHLVFSEKKSGELWSTNFGDLDVESYPPKSTFWGDHILTPRGCWAPKFLHMPHIDQVLLVHTPLGMGAPFTVFLKGVKNWL